MRVVAKKVQMIRLQEKQNKCVKNTETNYAEQYKIEKECIKLEKNTAKK